MYGDDNADAHDEDNAYDNQDDDYFEATSMITMTATKWRCSPTTATAYEPRPCLLIVEVAVTVLVASLRTSVVDVVVIRARPS